MTDGRRRRRPSPLWLRAAAVVLGVAVVGTVLVRAWPSSGAPEPAASPAEPDRSASASASAGSGDVTVLTPVPAPRVGSVVPERPVSARLPNGVDVPVEVVSTRTDGLLDVPHDIRTAGWWDGGAKIGDPFGSTLIAAHVDSTTQGLGPYVALLSVKSGQRVVVTTRHLRQTFRITSLRLVKQGSLADEKWIYSPSGARRLTLVTCAPPYDRSRGGYQNLAIVTAVPVAGPSRRGRP